MIFFEKNKKNHEAELQTSKGGKCLNMVVDIVLAFLACSDMLSIKKHLLECGKSIVASSKLFELIQCQTKK